MSNVTPILDKTTTAKLTSMITEKTEYRENRAPDIYCNFEERTYVFQGLVQGDINTTTTTFCVLHKAAETVYWSRIKKRCGHQFHFLVSLTNADKASHNQYKPCQMYTGISLLCNLLFLRGEWHSETPMFNANKIHNTHSLGRMNEL